MLSISQPATNRGDGAAYSNPGTGIRGPAAARAISQTELEKTYFNLQAQYERLNNIRDRSKKAYCEEEPALHVNMHSSL